MSQDTLHGRDNWMESPFGEWETQPAAEGYSTEDFNLHFSAEDFAPGGVAGLELPYRETADGRLEAMPGEDLVGIRAAEASSVPAPPPGAFRVKVKSARMGDLAHEPAPGLTKDAKGFTGLALAYQVASARDAATGLATGRRTHAPVVVRKRVGPSSPQLFQALVENHSLPEVVLEFFRAPTKLQDRSVFYRLTLKDAAVSAIRLTAGGSDGEVEEVSFTFQTITVEHLAGGITAEDRPGQR